MDRKDPEEMLELLGKIRDFLVIVEGKKDVKALNTLGITNIIAISGKPLIAVVEKVASSRESQRLQNSQSSQKARNTDAKRVHAVPACAHRVAGNGEKEISDIIILTDFDREGRHIAARLRRLLRAHRIEPNQRLRSRIMAFGFNRIEDITLCSVTRKASRL